MKINTILFATDFSDACKTAFPIVCALARDHGSRVIVLHVIPSGTYEVATVASLGMIQDVTHFRDDIRHNLEQYQAPVGGPPLEYKVAVGTPAATIVEVAEQAGCDLVVLATHPRSGLRGFLLPGGIPEQVMRHAHCPVLLARDRNAAVPAA